MHRQWSTAFRYKSKRKNVRATGQRGCCTNEWCYTVRSGYGGGCVEGRWQRRGEAGHTLNSAISDK